MTCSTNVNTLKSNASYIQNYLQTSTSFNPSYFVNYVNGQVSCVNNAINAIKQNTIANGGTNKDANIAISQSGLPILLTVYQELLSISNLNGLAYGANAQYQMDAQNYTLNKNSGNITSANEYTADQNKQIVYYNNLNALIQYLDGSALTPITSANQTINAYIEAVNSGQQIAPKVSTSQPTLTSSSIKTVIPTSNNQYPITTVTANITKTSSTKSTIPTTSTKISNPVSTAINVIKSKTTSIPNVLFNFYSMYRNYLLGLIILAIFVVIIAKGDKKHE